MLKKQLLIRDSRYDVGNIPSGTYWCSSPDLIVHEQVANPQTFLKENYDGADANQKINTGAAHNFIYTRCKNLSDERVRACIRSYASTSSLFMQPSLWKQNILKDMNDIPFVETEIIGKDQIGVGLVPFVFDARGKRNYCHIGYVTESRDIQPEIPESDFSSYGDFQNWITNNPHICLRNYSIFSAKSSYTEYSCFMSNPNNYACPYSLKITTRQKYPVGTVIEFKCSLAHLDAQHVVKTETEKDVFQINGEELLEAHFEGYVIASVYLPTGSSFKGGDINIEFFPGEIFSSNVLDLTVKSSMLGRPINRSRHLEEGTRLIKAGECSMKLL